VIDARLRARAVESNARASASLRHFSRAASRVMENAIVNAKTLVRRRCFAQGLASRRFDTEDDVFEWMFAMQSHERSIAPSSVARRARNRNESDIARAIADGRIIRTHVIRPTWRYVRAADARWLLELGTPRSARDESAPLSNARARRQRAPEGRLDGVAQLMIGQQHKTHEEIEKRSNAPRASTAAFWKRRWFSICTAFSVAWVSRA
jgi:hypothetical protein